MEYKKTQRGFVYWEFKDRYNKQCSLQKSSLATEDAIWLGCDDPEPQVLIPGKGWTPIELPEGDVSINTRMHLTQEQAKALVPLLIHFVDTGEMPEPDDVEDYDGVVYPLDVEGWEKEQEEKRKKAKKGN